MKVNHVYRFTASNPPVMKDGKLVRDAQGRPVFTEAGAREMRRLLPSVLMGKPLTVRVKRRATTASSPNVIEIIGDRCYRVPGGSPRTLSNSENDVLQVFLELPAIGAKQLSEKSGYGDPGRILHRLVAKYPEFRTAIVFPQRKGQGYRVNVRHA